MFATEVADIVDDAVCKQQLDLDRTKKLVFAKLPDGELPHAADVKLIENYFVKILIDCARIELEKKFQQLCSSAEFVNKFTHFSDRIATIPDLLDLCEAGIYATQLKLYSSLVDELDLTNFIVNLKVYIWKNILDKTTSGNAELQVLQRLVVCFQENLISESTYDELKKFKDNCEAQSFSAHYFKTQMKKVTPGKNSSRKLRAFLQAAENLTSDHLFCETQLLQLIRFYLKSVEITIHTRGNRSILEVTGVIVNMSQEIQQIQERLLSKQIDEVCDE
ncbi:unnamed protein product [Adineta ricciae]|uniref:Uncharacterized protein n=1 Tax=Adineta ricciae TaxID=249248 RepID=A0A815BWZ7_ADIRI|nr:unnamed protein product [Adineta ricciae]CAF1276227.1 unnamed protein product [Adineta ricciae]